MGYIIVTKWGIIEVTMSASPRSLSEIQHLASCAMDNMSDYIQSRNTESLGIYPHFD